MARQFTVGFETGNVTTEPAYSFQGGTFTVQSTTVHRGTYALSIAASSTYVKWNVWPLAAGKRAYSRFYFRKSGNPSGAVIIAWLENGDFSTACEVILNTNGTLTLKDGAGATIGSASSAVSSNAWHYIEIAASSGTAAGSSYVEARLDGASFASSTTADSKQNGLAAFYVSAWTSIGGITLYFDDLALNDDYGVCNASWPGAPGSTRTSTALAEAGWSTGGTNWFYGGNDVAHEAYFVDRCGAKWVRFDCYWYIVEPSKGTWDWSQMDLLFDAYDGLGIRKLILLHETPVWSGGYQGGQPSNPQDFADYCTAVVNRYANRGDYGCHDYEIWNEPTLSNWAHTASNVQPSLAAGYAAIKAADSTATCYHGGLLPETTGGNYTAAADYITDMYAAGGMPYIDVVTFHPYTNDQSDPSDTNKDQSINGWNSIAPVKSVFAAHGESDRRIMMTEWGYYTTPATTPNTGLSQATQSTYLAHGISRALAFTNCIGVIPFRILDILSGTSTADETNYGVVDGTFTAKTAFASMATAFATVTAPSNTSSPVGSGTHAPGRTLSSTNGQWTNLARTFTYQWQTSDNGVTGWSDIAGAASPTYSVGSAYRYKHLRCNVSAVNDSGTTSVQTGAIAPVGTGWGMSI